MPTLEILFSILFMIIPILLLVTAFKHNDQSSSSTPQKFSISYRFQRKTYSRTFFSHEAYENTLDGFLDDNADSEKFVRLHGSQLTSRDANDVTILKSAFKQTTIDDVLQKANLTHCELFNGSAYLCFYDY